MISRLHFNGRNNHFLTLGLPQTASAEEIRQRWKRLMMLYHPDRHEGNPEWVEARAKKVNEAYSELKDDGRRSQYLSRLADEERAAVATLRRRQEGSGAAPLPRQPFPNRTSRTSAKRSGPSFWKTALPNLPKILILLYLLAALFVLWTISRENRSAVLESELNRTETPSPAPPSPSLAAGPVSENPQDPSPSVPARALPATAAHPQPAAPAGGALTLKRPTEEPRPSRQETTLRSQIPAPVPAPAASEAATVVRQSAPPQEPDSPAPLPPAPEKPRPAAPAEPNAWRSEVEEFMQRYVRCYNTNDYNGFMALFAPYAVENNLNYSQIRSAYRATFSEKINQYSIQDMTIRPDRDGAVVSGTYVLNSYFSKEGRWMKFKGKITWRLTRDTGSLRIASIQYDR